MSEKIVLIDGHSILHRAFYGMPDFTNSRGFHTGAIFGFLNILFKIIDEEQPDYLAVAFDVHAPTFRHEMYEAYKGTRKPMPEELRMQVPKLKELLQAMNVLTVEKAGLEADDILGTIAGVCAEKGMDVSLISGDRDLLQVASEKILVRIPKTKPQGTVIEDYRPQDVAEKYGLMPKQIIDLKSLMGDSSDNIPGVPSIGEKTATKLLTAYGSLDGVYEHLEEITPPRARKALEENEELARLSYRLATINVGADIDFSLSDASIGDFYTPQAYDIFRDLQFTKMLSRFEGKSHNDAAKEETVTVVSGSSESESLKKAAREAKSAAFVVYKNKDVLPLFAGQQAPGGIAVSFDGRTGFYIPFENGSSAGTVVEQFRGLIKDIPEWVVFDLQELLKTMPFLAERRDSSGLTDLKLAFYELDPSRSDYTFEDLAVGYADAVIPQELPPEEEGGWNSAILRRSFEPLMKAIEDKGMTYILRNVDQPLAFALRDMEDTGILVDAEALHAYGAVLGEQVDALAEKIYEQAGQRFNINSPKQLGEVLFDKMGLPAAKKTKSGYSTAADVLEKLALDYPIVKDILSYRTVAKLKSTYADGLPNYISEEDGRIHGHFHQTITATGRISSTEPNLQNIPIRMEAGRQFRKVFHPAPGHVFLDADYSQIELRILASLSGDEALIEAFENGQDIHRSTASRVFHVPFEDVDEDLRRKAKAVNFGIVYGISAFGLGEDLSISRKEADQYIKAYFETYPKIKQFLDGQVSSGKKNGFVRTYFGRVREIPELSKPNFAIRSFGERVAMNSPIQGTAADIMKIAMYRVYSRLLKEELKSRIVLQVHDELLVETPEEEKEIVKKILLEEMTGAADLPVKLVVDIGEGTNWLEAH